jgi:hypothetical protein
MTQLAVQFLCRACEQVSTEVLDWAWAICEPDDYEEAKTKKMNLRASLEHKASP